MKTTRTPAGKRPVNLLLSETTVTQARCLTNNLSATVDSLLADYIRQELAARQHKLQSYAQVADAWNRVLAAQDGAFADEHSTL